MITKKRNAEKKAMSLVQIQIMACLEQAGRNIVL
jgi:hypothetical protein